MEIWFCIVIVMDTRFGIPVRMEVVHRLPIFKATEILFFTTLQGLFGTQIPVISLARDWRFRVMETS